MPTTFKTILCAHDLSHASRSALAFAVRLTRQLGARLVVLHVSPPPSERSELFGVYSVEEMEQLTGFARREQVAAGPILEELVTHANPPGAGQVPCEVLVRTGEASSKISQVATAEGADLIVVGTHARRGLQHMLLGSIAEHLVGSAPCPVLVARPTEDAA